MNRTIAVKRIRAGTAEDIPAIATLLQSGRHRDGVPRADEANLAALLASGLFLIFERDAGVLAAVAFVRLAARGAELGFLAVDPEIAEMLVGTRAIEAVLSWFVAAPDGADSRDDSRPTHERGSAMIARMVESSCRR
jgi:predicted N-acetyltransferase YhbS